MLKRLHHFGLVVPDIAAGLSADAKLGARLLGSPFEVPGRTVNVAYVDLGNRLIELRQAP